MLVFVYLSRTALVISNQCMSHLVQEKETYSVKVQHRQSLPNLQSKHWSGIMAAALSVISVVLSV